VQRQWILGRTGSRLQVQGDENVSFTANFFNLFIDYTNNHSESTNVSQHLPSNCSSSQSKQSSCPFCSLLDTANNNESPIISFHVNASCITLSYHEYSHQSSQSNIIIHYNQEAISVQQE
jgi:hypothetical protein